MIKSKFNVALIGMASAIHMHALRQGSIEGEQNININITNEKYQKFDTLQEVVSLDSQTKKAEEYIEGMIEEENKSFKEQCPKYEMLEDSKQSQHPFQKFFKNNRRRR